MINTSDQLIVNVFGKAGCAKCKILNQRVDALLTEPKYAAFKKASADVLTDEGLFKFCRAECLNPSRVPAMVISKQGADGKPQYLRNPNPDAEDAVCKKSKLYTYLGLQTDYSEEGKGVISPDMLRAILDEALAMEG